MHRFEIQPHTSLSDRIVRQWTNKSRLRFYAPDTKMHPEMFKIQLYQTDTTNDMVDGILLPGEALPSKQARIVGSFYAASRHILPFHLRSLVRIRTPEGMRLDWGTANVSPEEVAFWVFADSKHHRLYPFSVVIWPPAFLHYKEILDTLRENYTVVQHTTLSLPTALLLPFVLDVYQGDRRCDKSQLPRKCRHMTAYPTRLGYIKFLAPKADLDRNRVSQTAVKIKALLRERYRPTIKNYVHDIICHISDNAAHSRAMDDFVRQYTIS